MFLFHGYPAVCGAAWSSSSSVGSNLLAGPTGKPSGNWLQWSLDLSGTDEKLQHLLQNPFSFEAACSCKAIYAGQECHK